MRIHSRVSATASFGFCFLQNIFGEVGWALVAHALCPKGSLKMFGHTYALRTAAWA
nr:hypothetical protein [uncultured Kingella sp.]